MLYMCIFFTKMHFSFLQSDETGGIYMAKLKKNPSKAGISAASVTGNAGPTDRGVEKGRQGNNQQYKKHNMGEK